MLDRSFWERLKQTVDDVGGCNTGADTGITVARGGGGDGGTGTSGTEAGTTGAEMTETTGCG